MKWQGRVSVLAVIVFAELSASDVVPPWMGLPLLAISVLAAWRTVPRFWRMVTGGLVGGVAAGLLILGPGLRVAMRVVAIMDETQTPEFTLEGTFFIIVGIGAILGAIQGLTGHILRRVLNIKSSVVAGVLVGAFFVVQLAFFSGEISDEFFTLGEGALVNTVLFGVFSVAYGIAAMALASRFETEMFGSNRTERVKVPA